ncbi:MAG: hypothetical protein H7203_00380 [Rhizobacter sp.]|nr:hypothetical protein [Burkholderiales bacterium]
MAHDRETIAAVAARIIVESELTDWSLARRKAVAELGLSAHGAPLPSDETIIAEIKTYHALYGGDDWARQLRAQREAALEAMIELVRFDPLLTGPVAEGWAHAGSEIRIELMPESGKDVEYALLNLDIEFTPTQANDGTELYQILDSDWPMRLVVRAPGRAPDSRHKTRLTGKMLEQLLRENSPLGRVAPLIG